MSSQYDQVYARSLQDPIGFWAAAAEDVHWYKKWEPFYRWFGGAFWRVISEHNVVCFFTAPTGFRAIKREDPRGELLKKYRLPNFRTLFLAGERLDPDTLLWRGIYSACQSSITGGKRNGMADLRKLRGPGTDAGEAGIVD